MSQDVRRGQLCHSHNHRIVRCFVQRECYASKNENQYLKILKNSRDKKENKVTYIIQGEESFIAITFRVGLESNHVSIAELGVAQEKCG